MEFMFIGLAFLAGFHLIYEGVIAPQARMRLRNRLFELRDELRALKAESDEQIGEHAFELVHDAMNRFIHRLSSFTVFLVAEMRELRSKNPAAFEEAKRRQRQLEAVKSVKFQDIVHQFDRTLVSAMLWNAGAWFVYLVPIALVAVVLTKLSKVAMAIIVLPAGIFDVLIARGAKGSSQRIAAS